MKNFTINGTVYGPTLTFIIEDNVSSEPVGTYRSNDYWTALEAIKRLEDAYKIRDHWVWFDVKQQWRWNYAIENALNEARVYFKKGRLRDVMRVANDVL